MATAFNLDDSPPLGAIEPWAGLLLGIASWIGQVAVCLWLMSRACNQGFTAGAPARAILLAVTVVFAAAAVAGWALSVRSLRKHSSDHSITSFEAVSRTRYTMLLGAFASLVVTFSIALTCVPILALSICGATR